MFDPGVCWCPGPGVAVATGRNSIRNKARELGPLNSKNGGTRRRRQFSSHVNASPETGNKGQTGKSDHSKEIKDQLGLGQYDNYRRLWERHAEIKTSRPIASFASCPAHPTGVQSRRPRLSAHAC